MNACVINTVAQDEFYSSYKISQDEFDTQVKKHISSLEEYISQLEDEIACLKADNAKLSLVIESNRVKILCLESSNLILQMTGF